MAKMTVNGQRLRAQLETLADIARTPEGICRLSYSDSFWKSNDYVAQLMREAGMTVNTNPAGNVVGTYPGRSSRKITVGSHIDSVVNGGMFDGCLGVLAGIEAVRTLSENGIVPSHSIDVVAFAEEEGIVITGLIGSRAYCGLPPTEPVLQRMGEFGFTLQDLADAKCSEDIDYSLELHIEQGGVLEVRKTDIGVVRSIIALRRYTVEFAGAANHAGTTPMTLRDDALVKAARFITRVREVVMEVDPGMVGTVGHLEVQPNAMNVVPGHVTLTLELRGLREDLLERAYQTLMEEFREDIISCRLTMEQPCFHMSEVVQQSIWNAAQELGLTAMTMDSGAGHDSMSLSQVTRAGMIFVPSVGGISHSKEEFTTWDDVTNGANVLLHALCHIDRLETPGR